METVFVDTNIFLRYLIKDHDTQAQKSARIIEALESEKMVGYTSKLVIAEVVFVLRAYYDIARSDVAESIDALLAIEGLDVEDGEVMSEAVQIYRQTNIEFIDCYNAAMARARGLQQVASFDTDWDAFDGLQRMKL